MMFWLIVFILVLVSLGFLVFPLLFSTKEAASNSRVDANRALYHSKVEELQFDLDKGLLDQAEYDDSVQDLQKTLLVDVELDEAREFVLGKSIGLVASIVIALPVAAILMYQQFSTADKEKNVTPQQQAQVTQAQTMQASIIKLEQRLQQEPNNGEGWKMLGQSYFVLQQYEKALGAYSKASELANHADPNVMVLMAEASAFANNENFGEFENRLLSRALNINPQHERALWYAGYAAYSNNEFAKASKHWEKLLTLVPSDRPDVKANLLKFLNNAREKAGLSAVADSTQSTSNDAEPKRTITVAVSLSAELKENVSPTDALFIYARADKGPKMPLTLTRLTAADLPTEVTLTEEMAMMQNMTIRQFDQVQAVARISKSGQAITQAGDLVASPVLVDFSKSPTANVTLTINAVAE